MSEQDAPRPAPDAGEIEELLDVLICTTALAATQHYMVVPRWCERGVPPPADVRTQRQAVLDALLAAAARADALAGEVARLRAALEWYADELRYSRLVGDPLFAAAPVLVDGGTRARAALASAAGKGSDDGD